MAKYYDENLIESKSFTKTNNNDIMEVKSEKENTMSNNLFSNLNDIQKENIKSAYNAKKNGIISDKQFKDNLRKNVVSNVNVNSSTSLKKLPSEELEIERLRKITGEDNLNKVDSKKLADTINLKKKTPDDYYREAPDTNEEKKRLDEVFGAKTDFSISNFENNYDKFNQEEKEMITHKMQLEFNNRGYTDKDGFKLKTDGIFGNKTKSVYEQYKKDNNEDYTEAIENKNNFNTSITPSFEIYEDQPQIMLTSLTQEPSEVTLYSNQTNDKNSNIPMDTKLSPQNFSPEIYYSYEEFDHPEDVKKRAENPKIIKKADQVIKEHAEFIINAAKEYGVNPGILGACIYSEHVLNVDVKDSITDVFLGNRGFDTSIGVSQVLLSTAKHIEDMGYMPKIESTYDGSLISFVKGDENLKRVQALQDPKTNIMYAAAYLKYFQDRWKEAFPKIDGTTAILATLFNQGERFPPHGDPKPNDFGRFARNNYYHICRLLGI